MSAIESFIERVTTASKANSKELRIQIADAQALMVELAIMGTRNSALSDQVIKLQEDIIIAQKKTTQPKPESEEISIEMDGGNF